MKVPNFGIGWVFGVILFILAVVFWVTRQWPPLIALGFGLAALGLLL